MIDMKRIAVPLIFLGYFMKFFMTLVQPGPEALTQVALRMCAFFCHTTGVLITWLVNYTNFQNNKVLIWLGAIVCFITGK